MIFPLCNHHLLRWDGGKPIIDAGAVTRFAAHVRATNDGFSPMWSESACKEQAWAQAHDQLRLAKHERNVIRRLIEGAEKDIDALAFVPWREGTRARARAEELERKRARYCRALKFIEQAEMSEQRANLTVERLEQSTLMGPPSDFD